METATRVETIDVGPGDGCVRNGDKGVYRLSKPMIETFGERTSDHVYVSSACILGQWETYAFLCDEKGEVISWTELPCSMKGVRSHREVLADAGYEIVSSPLASDGEVKP